MKLKSNRHNIERWLDALDISCKQEPIWHMRLELLADTYKVQEIHMVLRSKHILRYLRGTTGYGIKYERMGQNRIIGYSDSSHNVDPDDRKSTTGHIFYYGSSPITWFSQKQDTVALLSCESEFMAATTTAC